MSSGDKVTVPFAIVPLLLGFGLVLAGAILLFFGFRPDMDSTATGSVSEIDVGESSNYVTVCSVTAVFTVDGQSYYAGSLDASNDNCDLHIGDPVVVEYSSANPATSQIRLDYLPWLGTALTAGGLLLLLLGGGLLIRSRLKRRH